MLRSQQENALIKQETHKWIQNIEIYGSQVSFLFFFIFVNLLDKLFFRLLVLEQLLLANFHLIQIILLHLIGLAKLQYGQFQTVKKNYNLLGIAVKLVVHVFIQIHTKVVMSWL